jgi:hypothetical protein
VRPAADSEYYVFRVEAWKDDRLVGDLYTHDGGAHSWNYRFRVRNGSLPRWTYLAAGACLVVLLLGARRALAPVDSEGRRRRIRRLGRGALVVLVVGAVAGAGYHFYREQRQRTLERETTRREDERQARHREFIATFVSAAPRPDWWESVETPYRVDNLGDLLAAWQGFPEAMTDGGSGSSSRPPTRASSITRMIRRWWPRPSVSCTGWSAITRIGSSSRDSATIVTSAIAGVPTTAPTAWWAIRPRVWSRT